MSAKKANSINCPDNNIRVYASFRSTEDQNLNKGSTVKFNHVDTNVGHGIRLYSTKDLFRIESGGHYLINFGVNGISEVDPESSSADVGISLVLNRNGQDFIKAQIYHLSSFSIILELSEGDSIRLVSQTNNIHLIHTDTIGGTAVATDTAYITFVKLLPKR